METFQGGQVGHLILALNQKHVRFLRDGDIYGIFKRTFSLILLNNLKPSL